jgi:hypothetical protein
MCFFKSNVPRLWGGNSYVRERAWDPQHALFIHSARVGKTPIFHGRCIGGYSYEKKIRTNPNFVGPHMIGFV